MRRLSIFGAIAVAGSLAVLSAVPARASDVQTYDKLAYMTFSAPVQIPWATLDPGTYRFRLANPSTSRNVIQVLSEDGSIVYSMFHTIADRRFTVTEDPIVTFRETPVGVPPAVRSLFYGGEERGYEFIYPDGQISTLTGGSTELTYLPSVPEAAVTSAALPDWAKPFGCAVPEEPCEEPTAAAEELAELAPTSGFEPAPMVDTMKEPTEESSARLPGTASPLPLVGLFGLLALALGLGTYIARRTV